MPKKEISSDYAERMKDPSLTYYEKFYGKSEKDVYNNLVHVMSKQGIARIEAAYDGGHDEGGVQELTAWDKDGNIVDAGSYEDELWSACDEVLSTIYYSWALGYSVYGRLYADVQDRRIWTDGEREETTYVTDAAIDWSW